MHLSYSIQIPSSHSILSYTLHILYHQTSMASSSSSPIMASPTANDSNYDVFLSFNGETRHSFTDHLYTALNRVGLRIFRDNEDIERGEELKPEIERGITESKASIIVLSQNYATSTWCLDELYLILKQRKRKRKRKECNHFVLPIFYHVEPSHVRKQEESFRIEVRTNSRWTDENVNRWKAALMEVADLKGETPKGSESQFITDIVGIIYNKLACKIVALPPNLVGMTLRYQNIESWFLSDAKVLTIFGMGGSGKTTLADYIVSSNWQHFEIISIVKDISGTCGEQEKLDKLYDNFCHDVLGSKLESKQINDCKLRRVLTAKKTLLVFDDVDDPSHLQQFLGAEKINEQSKIIVTTRNCNADDWFQSRSWRCYKYEMQLLDDDESLELLSLQAFGFKKPMEGYEEVAKQVLLYCEGNPLAVRLLGSSLAEGRGIRFWISTLHLLENDLGSGLERVLIRSYNSLPHNTYKELFLHIVCFFIDEDKDYVEKILDRGYFASSGIKTLINRCLLSVSPNNILMMHKLLQEMGRSIIRQESKRPAERTRSWLDSDSYKILHKGEGSKTLEGLALDMNRIEQGHLSPLQSLKLRSLKTDSLTKMDNLKLLKLNEVHLKGSYENFSEDLIWLCWTGFDLGALPSELFNGNLVAIDMRDSKLEFFEPPMVLQSLKILNLGGSKYLSRIRSISRVPNLETLILNDCNRLDHVCESIGSLMKLDLLDMVGCRNFFRKLGRTTIYTLTSGTQSSQQTSFSLPPSLVRLFLRSCHLECTGYFPLNFSVQLQLQYLDLGGGFFECLPSYCHLESLQVLDLSFCSRLKWLHSLPSTLTELYIYYCESLQEITFQSHQFTLQEFGYEGCINLCEIEGFIKLVPITRLDDTDLGHMKWLKQHQNNVVVLVGDDELTIGRNGLVQRFYEFTREDPNMMPEYMPVQMLYEFGIMSTSLPSIEDPNMMPEYMSRSSSVSFVVPPCPKKKRLKGLNVSFKHTFNPSLSTSDIDLTIWFAKISTNNGVDLMYNPKVYGIPVGFEEIVTWLSYWPIGDTLQIGDRVNVSIVVFKGLKVYECGASLVYADEDAQDETLQNNTQWVQTLGGDLSAFELSTGANYLCRRDFYKLMEVGGLRAGWLSTLVGDTNIDDTEVRGWRKTGRSGPPGRSRRSGQPKELIPSTELQPLLITHRSDQSQESTSSSTELQPPPSTDPSDQSQEPTSSSTELKKL